MKRNTNLQLQPLRSPDENANCLPQIVRLDLSPGQFRTSAPWYPSTHRCTSELAVVDGKATWKNQTVARGAVFLPSGWPVPYQVDKLLDPLGDDEEKFVWDRSSQDWPKVWVHGDLLDEYLRNIRAKGEPSTAATRICRPFSPTDMKRGAGRRLRCEYGVNRDSDCGCLCVAWDPTIAVPMALADKIEIRNDVQHVAMKIVEEANIGASLRRCCLQRADITLDSWEKRATLDIPRGHRIRFRVRNEKRAYLRESAGFYLADEMEEHIERAECEINIHMLPFLKEWLEGFRNVKIDRMKETARKFAEEVNQDLERTLPEGAPKPLGWKDPIREAELATRKGPHRPRLLCRCGHTEVFHARPITFKESALISARSSSTAAETRPCTPSSLVPADVGAPRVKPLHPPGPDAFVRSLPLQDTFPMIERVGKPKAPVRSRSDPAIAGGRLALVTVGVTLSGAGTPMSSMDPD